MLRLPWTRPARGGGNAPLIPALPKSILTGEVEALGAGGRLLRQGPFDVLLAPASRIPALLLEVGRAREMTFRGVNEGTGRSYDLDRFDEHYEHLVLWDRENAEVAGGYRMARTREVLRPGGGGLYTETLFRLDPKLFTSLGPAVELGRSFVHPAYQRKPHSLLLLWKGIGRYLERHPGCQVLFGPVSISGGYNAAAVRALTEWFRTGVAAEEALRRHVRARRAPRIAWKGGASPAFQTMREVDAAVRSIGGPAAERGIPVLLRQYLKLGGRVLECSVDPAFGGCLDALIVVDLRRTDREKLDRMLGTSLSADGGERASNRHAAGCGEGVISGVEI